MPALFGSLEEVHNFFDHRLLCETFVLSQPLSSFFQELWIQLRAIQLYFYSHRQLDCIPTGSLARVRSKLPECSPA